MTRCFSYSQIFLYECLMVIQDRYRPPLYHGTTPTETQLSSVGVCHWMEGLRQKGYTWATICLIAKIGKLLGHTCSLHGQGDNQIIVVRMPSSEDMTRRRSSYQSLATGLVETIASEAERLGWAIKGQVVKQGNGFSRIYTLELPVPPLRTVQQTVCDATIATQTG